MSANSSYSCKSMDNEVPFSGKSNFFVCCYCHKKFSMSENNVESAFKIHARTPAHIEAVSNIGKRSPKTASSDIEHVSGMYNFKNGAPSYGNTSREEQSSFSNLETSFPKIDKDVQQGEGDISIRNKCRYRELESIKKFVQEKLCSERNCSDIDNLNFLDQTPSADRQCDDLASEFDSIELKYSIKASIKSTHVYSQEDNCMSNQHHDSSSNCKKRDVTKSMFVSRQLNLGGVKLKIRRPSSREHCKISNAAFVTKQLSLCGINVNGNSFEQSPLNQQKWDCLSSSHKDPSFIRNRSENEADKFIGKCRLQANPSYAGRNIKTSESVNPNLVDKWLQNRGKFKFCVICDVVLHNEHNLNVHKSSLKHISACEAANLKRRKYGTEWKHENDGASFPSVEKVCQEIQQIYSSSLTVRLIYFLNKTCIFWSKLNSYTCGLCKLNGMSEEHSYNHISDNEHITRVTEIIKNCDAKSVSFEVSIVSSNADHVRKCYLCDTSLPENNLHNYEVHLHTQKHKEKTRDHFRMPRFQDWERGIVFRDGSPYCVFCCVVLPDGVTMQSHVTDPIHIRRL